MVFVTNFGQTHDVWPRAFAVDDVKMPFLKNALVMQIELDELTAVAKGELLSSTRDRLKRGDLFGVLHEAVRDALADERTLVEATEKLPQRFAQLTKAFRPGRIAAAGADGARGSAYAATDGGGAGTQAEPLPTRAEAKYFEATMCAASAVRSALRSSCGSALKYDAASLIAVATAAGPSIPVVTAGGVAVGLGVALTLTGIGDAARCTIGVKTLEPPPQPASPVAAKTASACAGAQSPSTSDSISESPSGVPNPVTRS